MNWNGLELPGNPYYQDDAVIIYHGDCREILPLIPDKSIDLVITSPPYNVGISYGAYQDNKPYEDYLDWLDSIWSYCYKAMVDGGRISINVGDTGRNPYYPVHCDIASRLRKLWFMMAIVIWDKQNCLSNTAWGSWQKPSSPSFRGLHEFIIIAGKGGKYLATQGEPYQWTAKEFLECTLEIWRISPETDNKQHPAPFPIEIPERLIKLFTYKENVTLDPFLGSGTTAFCAKKLNRKCIGIEIEEKYCEIAAKRCSQQVFNLEIL